MPGVVRIGDPWDCGDTQAQGSGNVFINGIPAARLTDKTEGHQYASVAIDSASSTVFVNGLGLARIGDHHPSHCIPTSCHDGSLSAGSPDVFADDAAGSMSDVPMSDAAAAAYGMDKAAFAEQGLVLTYGRLADNAQDDDFSVEDTNSDKYAVVSVDTYNNVVPGVADTTNSPNISGLNSVQSRKFVPIRPSSASGPTTQQDVSRSVAYGHDPAAPKATLGDTAPPATSYNTTTIPTSNDDIINFVGNFPANFPLSPHFTVGQLSFGYNGQPRVGKHPLIAQGGLSVKDIVVNLRGLAVNVLEPMLIHFPDMLINSGFRTPSTHSQHTMGQAADVYVPSLQSSKENLYQQAIWVRDNINYDQFIFETAGNNVWYHVSYNIAGNKPKTSSISCMTTATGGSPYTHSIVRIA